MSVDRWSLIRFLHVNAAMCWVGGQLMLSGVVLPVLRGALEPVERVPPVHATARRFATISNVGLLPVLLVTGISLAWHRGVTFESFGEAGYGRLLGIKLFLVVVSVALAALHGVMASRNPKSSRPLAISGLAVSLGIVVFATALVP